MSGIIQYLSFRDWLISLTMTSSRFIHVVACEFLSCLKLNTIPLHIYTMFLLIHSSTNGHLAWSHLLTIVNNAAVNIDVHIPLCNPAFNFLG